jgi:hypothetical protein
MLALLFLNHTTEEKTVQGKLFTKCGNKVGRMTQGRENDFDDEKENQTVK